jgi:hypothetical protein
MKQVKTDRRALRRQVMRKNLFILIPEASMATISWQEVNLAHAIITEHRNAIGMTKPSMAGDHNRSRYKTDGRETPFFKRRLDRKNPFSIVKTKKNMARLTIK